MPLPIVHAMRFTVHPALRDIVQSVVVSATDVIAAGCAPMQTFLPKHLPFLAFFTAQPLRVLRAGEATHTCAPTIIVGPQSSPVQLDLGSSHTSVLMNFRPAALHRLLGLRMDSLVDTDVDAQSLLGTEVAHLHEALLSANGKPEEQNRLVQDYVVRRLDSMAPPSPFDAAIRRLDEEHGNITVNSLAAMAGVGVRQFERLSAIRLGMSPKLYARILRFRYARKLRARYQKLSWTEISILSGYFDQMHLIHDCRKFAGIMPSQMRPEGVVFRDDTVFKRSAD